MLHSISSSHFPTHRNCKRNACRLSLIACNLSHKNCTHKCVCVLLKIIYCRIMHIFITLELHKFRHYCTLRPAAAPSSSHSSSSLLLCLAAHRQVIVASSRWLQQSHTQTHTDRQTDRRADRLCICICGSSAEGLDFCMPWLSQCLTEKVLLGWAGQELHLNAAHVLCRKFLSFIVFCQHLPHGLLCWCLLLLWNLDFYGPNGSKCWKLALQLDSCHLPSIRNAQFSIICVINCGNMRTTTR